MTQPAANARRCPQCGAMVLEGEKFCANCGARVEQDPGAFITPPTRQIAEPIVTEAAPAAEPVFPPAAQEAQPPAEPFFPAYQPPQVAPLPLEPSQNLTVTPPPASIQPAAEPANPYINPNWQAGGSTNKRPSRGWLVLALVLLVLLIAGCICISLYFMAMHAGVPATTG